MVRLRFVEEYRGRRIVTNGKLYGIQGELVTDCRYLNPQGAKAAINSECAIEERRKYHEWQAAQAAKYVNREGKKNTYVCDCGWRGGYRKLEKDEHGNAALRCPRCRSATLYMFYDDALVSKCVVRLARERGAR